MGKRGLPEYITPYALGMFEGDMNSGWKPLQLPDDMHRALYDVLVATKAILKRTGRTYDFTFGGDRLEMTIDVLASRFDDLDERMAAMGARLHHVDPVHSQTLSHPKNTPDKEVDAWVETRRHVYYTLELTDE